MRGTRLEVKLSAIKSNLKKLQSKISHATKTIAIVKADAYGLGAVNVAKHLENDVWGFGTATIEEAVELRLNKIKNPIIMLSPYFEGQIDKIMEHDITPTVLEAKMAYLLSKKAKNINKEIKIHIKIDTGMGRLGLPYDSCVEEIKEICSMENLVVQGIYSHFPSADILDKEFSDLQIERFNGVVKQLEDAGINIPIKHLANSSAIVSIPESHKDAIRPGLLMYGTYPSTLINEMIEVEPVATLKAKIIFTKTIKAGESVSYGRTFIAQRDTRMGVLSLGYADGFSTLNSSKSFVHINNKFAPVLGRVCMDYTMIDITNIEDADTGTDVVIFGEGGDSVKDYASRIGLIPYEALTSISKRVPRIYV